MGLGTEEEEGYRTDPLGYGGIHSLESIPGPHTRLKLRARHIWHTGIRTPPPL